MTDLKSTATEKIKAHRKLIKRIGIILSIIFVIWAVFIGVLSLKKYYKLKTAVPYIEYQIILEVSPIDIVEDLEGRGFTCDTYLSGRLGLDPEGWWNEWNCRLETSLDRAYIFEIRADPRDSVTYQNICN